MKKGARMPSSKAIDKSRDYIIVGAGSAGCVVANRLSANPDVDVLLLEAGGRDSDPDIHSPGSMLRLFGSDIDWMFLTEKQPHLNGRQVLLNQGKVLGGSSSINSMIYIRGNRRDFDYWNYTGNEGWGFSDVLIHFKKSENFEGGKSEYHGTGGPLSVVRNHRATAAAQAFARAAVELGFRGPNWDFNGSQQENGAGLYQYTITGDGKRCSAAVAFLKPVLGRPNLEVRTGVQVSRVIVEGSIAVGVEYIQDSRLYRVRACKELILSAGAIGTPKLLMLSGIGPAIQLRAHGIPVVVDLPGVGQNLQDHVALPIIFKAKQEPAKPASIAEAGLFLRTRRGLDGAGPDLQYHFQAGIPDLSDPRSSPDPSKIMFGSVLCKPHSRGSVCLRSANPLDQPAINPNYLQCEVDLEAQLKGIELARALAGTRALAPFIDQELAPGISNKAFDLRMYIRNNASTMWHPACTCKMGHDADAVVDPQLRVNGIDALRIADASVMPTIVSGNTNATCSMIGEKAAEMILGRDNQIMGGTYMSQAIE